MFQSAKYLLILLVSLLTLSIPVSANVALSKYRLYFDGSTRSDALQLRNTSAAPISFSATIELVAMTEEGTLRKIDADPYSAIGLIRYSPKRGTIAPGGIQALRFAVRKPAGLEEGEYRAVLRLSSSLSSTQAGNVTLNPTLAYNVPIIIRHGRTSATTELQSPQLVFMNDTPHIEMWQSVEGNRSLYGNFYVTDSEGEEIGVLNNIALYRPLTRRKVLIPLNKEASGDVTIRYQEIAQFGGTLEESIQVNLN